MFALTIIGVTLSAIWAVIIVIVWILIAFLPATIAKNKGYSFLGWFILSLFFWWITLFITLFIPDRSQN